MNSASLITHTYLNLFYFKKSKKSSRCTSDAILFLSGCSIYVLVI